MKPVFRLGMLVLLLALLVGQCGCARLFGREDADALALYVAADAYATTMRTLAEYRAQKKIDDEQADAIKLIRKDVRRALDEWRAAIELDLPAEEVAERARQALNELLLAQLRAERNSHD